MQRDLVIAVHGGAGGTPTPERAARRQAGIDAALEAGLSVLRAGGTALDAVCAAVVVLEDDPSFNAGRGGVATSTCTVWANAARMKISPAPVPETAHAVSSAHVPAPISGVSPTRPGS